VPAQKASNAEAQSRVWPSMDDAPLRHRRQLPALAFFALPQSMLNILGRADGHVPSCRRWLASADATGRRGSARLASAEDVSTRGAAEISAGAPRLSASHRTNRAAIRIPAVCCRRRCNLPLFPAQTA
jgi:hypothetical protein